LCRHSLHGCLAEDHFAPRFDIPNIPTGINHILGQLRLERRITDKHHQRVNRGSRNIQQGFQRFDVLIVLVQWVLKFMGVFVDFLGSGLLVGRAEYPALHIFGFNYEHAVARHNNVVDLCGAIIGL